MALALISLGANLGDRDGSLTDALRVLGEHPQISVAGVSAFPETAPVGGPAGQPAFLNGAALLETSLPARDLLAALQQIEASLGREREVRWGARTLDLDLLLYDDVVIHDAALTLPHPRMAYRRFVLEAAAEAAPQMRHPQIGWTVAELLAHLNAAPNYLAIASICEGAAELARRVAETSGAAFCPDPGRSSEALRDTIPELAERRSEALRECLANSPGGAVSGFWIDQQQAYLDAAGLKNFSSELKQRYDAAVRVAPHPKLLVLLEDRGRARPDPTSTSVADRLHTLVTRPRRGPFLILDAAGFQENVEELTAALIAMR